MDYENLDEKQNKTKQKKHISYYHKPLLPVIQNVPTRKLNILHMLWE